MVTILDKDDFANGITGVGQVMSEVSMRLDQNGNFTASEFKLGS